MHKRRLRHLPYAVASPPPASPHTLRPLTPFSDNTTNAIHLLHLRLYEFPTNGGSDPSINPGFLPELKSVCPKNGDVNVRLAMDRGSEKVFDKQILGNIRSGTAVLQSDAALYQDEATKRAVDSYFGLSLARRSRPIRCFDDQTGEDWSVDGPD
ncbi:hypothetical protein SASPL_115499 [Salvia splendens]|uniref:peroxidase n=1 Tax=Salvia splendens TaxID=180675 RepID=A0A8X8Y7P8_SALSN|nr:hypothetical protein SASPL_115499 [Salvia splendens]